MSEEARELHPVTFFDRDHVDMRGIRDFRPRRESVIPVVPVVELPAIVVERASEPVVVLEAAGSVKTLPAKE